jgi:hypothetical protein
LQKLAFLLKKRHSEQQSGVILTSMEPNIFRMLFSIKGSVVNIMFLIFDGKQQPKNIWFRGC